MTGRPCVERRSALFWCEASFAFRRYGSFHHGQDVLFRRLSPGLRLGENIGLLFLLQMESAVVSWFARPVLNCPQESSRCFRRSRP